MFARGQTPVMFATDVAARGLDIKDVRMVINFDMPLGDDGVESCALPFHTMARMRSRHSSPAAGTCTVVSPCLPMSPHISPYLPPQVRAPHRSHGACGRERRGGYALGRVDGQEAGQAAGGPAAGRRVTAV